MKSKKLLVLIAVIAAVVVVVVVLAAVFAVKDVVLVYHDFDGTYVAAPNEGGISTEDVSKLAKGKSAIFLSKTKLLDLVNSTYTDWHAFAVVKNFPNTVEIHVVKCTAMLKIDVNGKEVYVDCFGYVMNPPESGRVMDVTSAFKGTDTGTLNVGQKIEFTLQENNARLEYVLKALLATWQCNIEPSDLAALLGDNNVFSFDEDNNLLIKPFTGGTIKVISPQTNLTNRLIDAYGVYYNEYTDLQNDDWTITVHEDGRITTPNPDR
ncbi:MAG: hypothetical protein J1F66_02945 [Clostridiales bacterium]|nr:hypothetical protein [Clostridiales bacterium]